MSGHDFDPFGRAAFRAPFRAQVAALRLRLGNLVPTAAWDDLWQEEHARAFAVAGALKADLLADLAEAVRAAIEDGETLEAFRARFRSIVERHGWHGWTGEGTVKGENWRTRVIWRTNIATSYAAGRMAQLRQIGYKFWVYRHGGSREPRLQHLAWDGLILPPDHPFWDTHAPPNGWGCSCRIRGAHSLDGAVRKGGKPGLQLPPGWDAIDPRTGAPKGIDRGWGYAVGRSTAEEIAAQLAQKVERLPPALGAGLVTEQADAVASGWRDWAAAVLAGENRPPALVGAISDEIAGKLGGRGAAPVSAEIMVAQGLLRGPKAVRHEAAGDALTVAEWLALPERIAQPQAVLLDLRTGKVLYVLGADGSRAAQLAVELDVVTGRKKDRSVVNLVVSAYRPKLSDLLGRLAGGVLALLSGALG